MQRLRDLLRDGPVLETKVREQLARDYLHGRALRTWERDLENGQKWRRARGLATSDYRPRKRRDPVALAHAGRRVLVSLRINAHVRRGVVRRVHGEGGLTYLEWVA